MDRQNTVELFRERLQAVIANTGLNRARFARKVGLDRSTLSQILSPSTGRLPRVETLIAIAQSEQVSIDWLVGLSQEGGLRADIIHDQLEIQPGGSSPSDERISEWQTEAIGYKIRSVPTTLPDLLKTREVIQYEYMPAAIATPEQRHETSLESLDYIRRPETDTEICTPVQSLENLAEGTGVWRGLSPKQRKRQLRHMQTLVKELYPTLRWFLYDGLNRFSVPMTIFGPKRAAIYLGQMYMVLNGREQIEALKVHFDDLIRAAVVQPPEIPAVLERLLASIS
jgi:transcriptional regulator with XRE-family HTH domain